MNKKLSILIIVGNEENMIADCIKSCDWADELVFVAANSTDNSVKIIKSLVPKAKIVHTTDEYNKNFSKWRNLAYENSTNDWVFYLDCDERITPKLKKELLSTINLENSSKTYYVVPRANHFLGQRVRHGGTYPDYVKRLYRKPYFKGYQGILHEEPIITGEMGYLKSDLLHYTHRDLYSMLNKTIAWTDMQAKALLEANHPKVVWWRFLRMMATKFFERLIVQGMWKDGIVGWISVIFETFDTFIIYARLWELQQKK